MRMMFAVWVLSTYIVHQDYVPKIPSDASHLERLLNLGSVDFFIRYYHALVVVACLFFTCTFSLFAESRISQQSWFSKMWIHYDKCGPYARLYWAASGISLVEVYSSICSFG
jgi:hypothetical protein